MFSVKTYGYTYAGKRFESFNRTPSRVVSGLLTGHNTLRRYFYVMGLINSALCRRCGVEEHVVCEREALPSLRHSFSLGSFSWTQGMLGV